MKKLRRFGTAMALAGMIAGGMILGSARLEAKGKGGGGGTQSAVCAYLLDVITYPGIDPTILAYAEALYVAYGCNAQ